MACMKKAVEDVAMDFGICHTGVLYDLHVSTYLGELVVCVFAGGM